MKIHGYILFFIALLELCLGLFILSRNKKEAINITYFIIVIGTMTWALANALVVFVPDYAVFTIEKFAYIGGAIIAGAVLFLSWVFPYKTAFITKKNFIIAITPGILIVALLLFTRLILKDFTLQTTGYQTYTGKLFMAYVVYFVFYFAWAGRNLYKKYLVADGIHRWQLQYIMVSIFIPFVISLITDIIIPMFRDGGWVTLFLGSESAIIWLTLTAYVAFGKYRLVKVNH